MPKGKSKSMPDEEKVKSTGLEGAAEEDSGVIRHADVEGGEEIAIDVGPPSFAGGVRGSPVPNRADIREGED